jgi:hypothetical protein
MAEIGIGQLGDTLSEEEIATLAGKLEELGAPTLPRADDGTALTVGDIDDEIMSEFLDRLDAHDMGAEIYLPMDFDGKVEVAGRRVASASVLLDVLEEMKDELGVEEDDEEEEEEEDEEDSDVEILAGQLRTCWSLFYEGASAAVDKHLPMYVLV